MAADNQDHYTEPVKLPKIRIENPLIVSCVNRHVVRWGRFAIKRRIDLYGKINLSKISLGQLEGYTSTCDLTDPSAILVPTVSIYVLCSRNWSSSYCHSRGFYLGGRVWTSGLHSRWMKGDVKGNYNMFDRYEVNFIKEYNTPEIIKMIEDTIGDVLPIPNSMIPSIVILKRPGLVTLAVSRFSTWHKLPITRPASHCTDSCHNRPPPGQRRPSPSP